MASPESHSIKSTSGKAADHPQLKMNGIMETAHYDFQTYDIFHKQTMDLLMQSDAQVAAANKGSAGVSADKISTDLQNATSTVDKLISPRTIETKRQDQDLQNTLRIVDSSLTRIELDLKAAKLGPATKEIEKNLAVAQDHFKNVFLDLTPLHNAADEIEPLPAAKSGLTEALQKASSKADLLLAKASLPTDLRTAIDSGSVTSEAVKLAMDEDREGATYLASINQEYEKKEDAIEARMKQAQAETVQYKADNDQVWTKFTAATSSLAEVYRSTSPNSLSAKHYNTERYGFLHMHADTRTNGEWFSKDQRNEYIEKLHQNINSLKESVSVLDGVLQTKYPTLLTDAKVSAAFANAVDGMPTIVASLSEIESASAGKISYKQLHETLDTFAGSKGFAQLKQYCNQYMALVGQPASHDYDKQFYADNGRPFGLPADELQRYQQQGRDRRYSW